jgi:hypothetical protein
VPHTSQCICSLGVAEDTAGVAEDSVGVAAVDAAGTLGTTAG